jgi:hypothetical protein
MSWKAETTLMLYAPQFLRTGLYARDLDESFGQVRE